MVKPVEPAGGIPQPAPSRDEEQEALKNKIRTLAREHFSLASKVFENIEKEIGIATLARLKKMETFLAPHEEEIGLSYKPQPNFDFSPSTQAIDTPPTPSLFSRIFRKKTISADNWKEFVITNDLTNKKNADTVIEFIATHPGFVEDMCIVILGRKACHFTLEKKLGDLHYLAYLKIAQAFNTLLNDLTIENYQQYAVKLRGCIKDITTLSLNEPERALFLHRLNLGRAIAKIGEIKNSLQTMGISNFLVEHSMGLLSPEEHSRLSPFITTYRSISVDLPAIEKAMEKVPLEEVPENIYYSSPKTYCSSIEEYRKHPLLQKTLYSKDVNRTLLINGAQDLDALNASADALEIYDRTLTPIFMLYEVAKDPDLMDFLTNWPQISQLSNDNLRLLSKFYAHLPTLYRLVQNSPLSKALNTLLDKVPVLKNIVDKANVWGTGDELFLRIFLLQYDERLEYLKETPEDFLKFIRENYSNLLPYLPENTLDSFKDSLSAGSSLLQVVVNGLLRQFSPSTWKELSTDSPKFTALLAQYGCTNEKIFNSFRMTCLLNLPQSTPLLFLLLKTVTVPNLTQEFAKAHLQFFRTEIPKVKLDGTALQTFLKEELIKESTTGSDIDTQFGKDAERDGRLGVWKSKIGTTVENIDGREKVKKLSKDTNATASNFTKCLYLLLCQTTDALFLEAITKYLSSLYFEKTQYAIILRSPTSRSRLFSQDTDNSNKINITFQAEYPIHIQVPEGIYTMESQFSINVKTKYEFSVTKENDGSITFSDAKITCPV